MSESERDTSFAGNIREYYESRLGVTFYEKPYGFIGYSIEDSADGRERHLTIAEWFMRPSTSHLDTLRTIREVITIGKEDGCTHLIGCNDSNLATYEKIKTIHTWFKMKHVGNNGSLEYWAREI